MMNSFYYVARFHSLERSGEQPHAKLAVHYL